MKKILFLSFLFITSMLSAQKSMELPLWPNGAPNDNGLDSSPSITVYPAGKPNGLAIIMCPGGGYSGLAMHHEGHDMASWFNTQGITACQTGIMKYHFQMRNRLSALYASMLPNGISTLNG